MNSEYKLLARAIFFLKSAQLTRPKLSRSMFPYHSETDTLVPSTDLKIAELVSLQDKH